jgi:Cofactor assembly of complex C subunit B, CCB2/CCB4
MAGLPFLLLVTRSIPACAFSCGRPTGVVLREATPWSCPRSSTEYGRSRLFAESDTPKSSKAKGVYVRPSGAIERGSGFFVPGLEGPRVRVLFGGVLLGLTALNHVLVPTGVAAATTPTSATTVSSFSLEEQIAIFYSVLVLFQAAIEFRKEELIVEGASRGGGIDSVNSANRGSSISHISSTGNNNKSFLQKDLTQKWNQADQLAESEKDKIQWAAASFLSVTPATQMLLLSKDSIVYQLGSDESSNTSDSAMSLEASIQQGVRAALEQLSRSKGGRIALPGSHPAVAALGLQSARTVVLQRISEDSCWVMSSSDQLLASFASADLKWLGQLARYIAI